MNNVTYTMNRSIASIIILNKMYLVFPFLLSNIIVSVVVKNDFFTMPKYLLLRQRPASYRYTINTLYPKAMHAYCLSQPAIIDVVDKLYNIV